jgi:hypothetical protein
MSFNVKELIKIRKATSNSEKSKRKVANYVGEFKSKINRLNEKEPKEKKELLIKMMNEESNKRKKALSTGVSSYSDPNWAGPSACESLIHCILGGDTNEIRQANSVIDELLDVNRKEESSKSKSLGFLILLIGSPLAFYFLNWWSGLITIFLAFVIIGWKNRYD